MKRIFLLALGAGCALGTFNAKALTADEAAMTALYPEHETFFEHELHPVAKPEVAPPAAVKVTIASMDLILVEHIAQIVP
jgi:hypothetical protein